MEIVRNRGRIAVALLLTAAACGTASASVSDPALIIYAQSGANVDTFTVSNALLGAGPEVGSLQYSLPVPLFLPNTGTWVRNLNLSFVPQNGLPAQDNLVSLGFTMWSGSAATNFIITTGEFTLPGAPAVIGRSSANVGISDGHQFAFPDGTADYTAGFAGGGYSSQTNGWYGAGPAYAANGIGFGIIGPAALSASFGSNSGGGSIPNTLLGVPGTSMSTQWSFGLTGGDQIGVTSTFITSSIIPAPASAALLGLGGLLASRRRR